MKHLLLIILLALPVEAQEVCDTSKENSALAELNSCLTRIDETKKGVAELGIFIIDQWLELDRAYRQIKKLKKQLRLKKISHG